MIRRVLIAVVGLILLTLPRSAAATDLPVATWDAEGVKVTISGPCDAEINAVLITLYHSGGPSYGGGDCQATGQGGHYSFTYPLAPHNLPFPGYPTQLAPSDAVIVDDPIYEASVTIYAPPFPPSVTLGNLAQTYDGTPRNATVTAVPSDLAYTITYDSHSAAPVFAGAHQVSVAVMDPRYVYVGSTTGTLVVSQASQTITFAALDPVVLGVQPIVLSASASSGLEVTYTSSDPSVASVSGSTVTVHAAGTATITASQAGDPTSYSAAADVKRDLVVGQPQSVPVPAAPGWTVFGLAALLFAVGTTRLSRNPRPRRPTSPA